MGKTIFNTNIMCGGCKEKVTATLDALVGKGNWDVDIKQPTKPLSVSNDTVSVDSIKESLSKIGFKVELI